jgi:hypothetical protein
VGTVFQVIPGVKLDNIGSACRNAVSTLVQAAGDPGASGNAIQGVYPPAGSSKVVASNAPARAARLRLISQVSHVIIEVTDGNCAVTVRQPDGGSRRYSYLMQEEKGGDG